MFSSSMNIRGMIRQAEPKLMQGYDYLLCHSGFTVFGSNRVKDQVEHPLFAD